MLLYIRINENVFQSIRELICNQYKNEIHFSFKKMQITQTQETLFHPEKLKVTNIFNKQVNY